METKMNDVKKNIRATFIKKWTKKTVEQYRDLMQWLMLHFKALIVNWDFRGSPACTQETTASCRLSPVYTTTIADAGRSCAICGDDFVEGEEDKVITLDCGHRFHRECINIYLKQLQRTNVANAPLCPMCADDGALYKKWIENRLHERAKELRKKVKRSAEDMVLKLTIMEPVLTMGTPTHYLAFKIYLKTDITGKVFAPDKIELFDPAVGVGNNVPEHTSEKIRAWTLSWMDAGGEVSYFNTRMSWRIDPSDPKHPDSRLRLILPENSCQKDENDVFCQTWTLAWLMWASTFDPKATDHTAWLWTFIQSHVRDRAMFFNDQMKKIFFRRYTPQWEYIFKHFEPNLLIQMASKEEALDVTAMDTDEWMATCGAYATKAISNLSPTFSLGRASPKKPRATNKSPRRPASKSRRSSRRRPVPKLRRQLTRRRPAPKSRRSRRRPASKSSDLRTKRATRRGESKSMISRRQSRRKTPPPMVKEMDTTVCASTAMNTTVGASTAMDSAARLASEPPEPGSQCLSTIDVINARPPASRVPIIPAPAPPLGNPWLMKTPASNEPGGCVTSGGARKHTRRRKSKR